MTNFEEALKAVNFNNPNVEIEYRLYYDDTGSPLYYSTEDLEGNYVTVSKEEHTLGRYDITIVNEKIIYPTEYIYQKLIPSVEGTVCNTNDVSIVSDNGQEWSLKRYE